MLKYLMIIFLFLFLLKKVKNIVNIDILKVKNLSGVYSSSKPPVFDEYDVQNVDYLECSVIEKKRTMQFKFD
uniref:hypothetical protein n=1 Tax=Gracilariopsis tenuifrons TaxID=31472 RepID=UPI001D1004D7|nr:hypothetical protein LK036_pgp006 [Gracilariopsis tenuifrons]UAD89359.1 hypothetical protein [Gracilariopsis tenuifrons]